MIRLSVIASMLVAVAAAIAATACGAGTPADTPSQSAAPNDPALEAAAERVRPVLEESFADSFAGLELRHDAPLMIVYRRPNPQLDAEVARVTAGVPVTFGDARYSLATMTAAIDELFADADYWHDRGMAITGAAPAVDGSGVQVATSGDADTLAKALPTRYRDMSFTVRTGTVVPPVYTGPPPIVESPDQGKPRIWITPQQK